MKKNKATSRAARRSKYAAGFESGGESKYAKKLKLKMGRGEVSPMWMWWAEGSNGR